jgi:hypothetical protein
MGNTEIEDALQELDRLTQEEARTASAELLKITHSVDGKVMGVDDRVKCVNDNVQEVGNKVQVVDIKIDQANRSSSPNFPLRSGHPDTFIGNQLRDSLLRWLSPPDPSINHNIACKVHHHGSAQWFFQGSIFNQWKPTGSFLWLQGKRAFLHPFTV